MSNTLRSTPPSSQPVSTWFGIWCSFSNCALFLYPQTLINIDGDDLQALNGSGSSNTSMQMNYSPGSNPGGGGTGSNEGSLDGHSNHSTSSTKGPSVAFQTGLSSPSPSPPPPAPALSEHESHPAPIDSPLDSTIPAMVRATQYGEFEKCRQFIEHEGFDVNTRDHENVTMLHWAAINNRAELVKYFISKGAAVDAIGGDLRSTPLHWATRQGHLGMVILLLQHRADPSLLDGDGFNCLHLAAQMGLTPIVAYFIAKGQDINAPDLNGMTPLMWSALRKNTYVDYLF